MKLRKIKSLVLGGGYRRISPGKNNYDATGNPTPTALTETRSSCPCRGLALMLEGALGSPAGTLHAPLYSFFRQSHLRTLWSDASGDSIGVYSLESGK